MDINKKHWLCVLIALLILPMPTRSQGRRDDKADLLSKISRAHGANATSCRSTVIDMEVVLVQPMGLQCTGRILAKPGRYRLEYRISPGNIYRLGYNGIEGWIIDEPDLREPRKLGAEQVAVLDMYSMLYSHRWLDHLRSQAGALKHLGKESYRGSDVEVLQAILKSIGSVDFLFESGVNLLKAVRFNYPNDRKDRYEILFASYVDLRGLKSPRRISIIRNDQLYRDYTVTKEQVCTAISDNLFNPDL
jgi:hypothetical protein